jgi:hypothetical protein
MMADAVDDAGVEDDDSRPLAGRAIRALCQDAQQALPGVAEP